MLLPGNMQGQAEKIMPTSSLSFLFLRAADFSFFLAVFSLFDSPEVITADADDAGAGQPKNPRSIRLTWRTKIDLRNPLGYTVPRDEVNLHGFGGTLSRDRYVVSLIGVVEMKFDLVESVPVGRRAFLLPALVFGNDGHPLPSDTRRISDVATDGVAMVGFVLGMGQVGKKKKKDEDGVAGGSLRFGHGKNDTATL